jgi:hypothetical protein
MHRDGLERIRRRADCEQCAERADCDCEQRSEPASSASDQRGFIHCPGSTGSRASADYVAAASGTGTSCDPFPDSVRGNSGFERDAAANCRPEHAQRCEQRTGHGEREQRCEQRAGYAERESGANSYADRHRAAGVTWRGHDEQQAGLFADARHREIRVRAPRHFA